MAEGCHQSGAGSERKDELPGRRLLLLVGNPNIGKSVIFSRLTGKHATISNYPGTTVTVTEGKANFDNRLLVVDTPGVNSLVPQSEDEKVARDMLLDNADAVVAQVADSKNLRRALLLSAQLAEMQVPFTLALNMWDEAEARGVKIDPEKLSQRLGVPVACTVAVDNRGMDALKGNIPAARKSGFKVDYGPEIEKAISSIEVLLPPLPLAGRFVALMALAGDEDLMRWLTLKAGEEVSAGVKAIATDLQSRYARPLAYLISKRQAEEVDGLLSSIYTPSPSAPSSLAAFLGRWSMHPLAGIPVLLLVLYFFYLFVGVLGAGSAVNFVESTVFGRYINPAATRLFELVPLPWLTDMMVGQYGLITMGLTYSLSIVLPVVGFFFLVFSFVEDVGYLPRIAVMMNRIFRAIGLSGKAVLPMVLGLGCDTMATITTRVLESKRERVIATLLLALAVPCSAQMAVILALVGGLSFKATALFFGVILSQLLLVGFLASRLMPGERSDFVLEIPPVRMPHLSNLLLKTVTKMEWYFKEAVPLILFGTFLLFVLSKAGILSVLEKGAMPVVQGWLGLPAQATNAFIMGFLRRDYGAAGLYVLAEKGQMDVLQTIVGMVVITLFIPCIANLLIIFKERGTRTALAIVAFIFPYAIAVGGVLNFILRALGARL